MLVTSSVPRRAVTPADSHRVAGPASVCALVLCALLVVMQLYVAIPLAPVLGGQLGGDATAALGTAFFAYAAGFLVFGPLSDRYGRKTVLVPGIAVMAVATAGLAVAPSLTAVGLLRVLQGFAAGCFSPAALAYLSEALPQRSRTIAIGAVSTAYLVAGIAGQVYASAVAIAWGWRWVFGAAAAALGATVLVLAALLRDAPRDPAPVSLARRFHQLGGLLARREFALPCLAVFTVMLSFVAMYSELAPYLARFGLDDADIVSVRLGGLPGMMVAPFAGAWVSRFGTVRTAVAGYAITAAGLAGEAAASGSVVALVVASNVFVAGIAITSTAMVTLFGDRAGHARGAGTSLYGFVLFLGASTGPYTVRLGLGFVGLLLVLAVPLLVAAVLVAVSGPREERLPGRAAG
jgi:predicted MFS family arabinose efflux permease